MIVGDFALADDHMMRQYAAHRFVEPATDGFVGNLELVPSLGVASVQFLQGLFHEIERGSSGIRLEVGARAITFDGVAPLRDLPFEFHFRQRDRFWQINLYTLPVALM